MVQTRSASAARATPPPPATRPSPTATATTTTTTATSPPAAILSHTPSTAALVWLAVSLPLVAWDTGYVLLRPRSMPGGDLHWPLWVPYELYGRVDHIYGFKQWHLNNGFTAAQSSLNLIESLMYLYYVYVWSSNAAPAPAGSGRRAALTGRPAARAVLVLFAALVMTLSKTILVQRVVVRLRQHRPQHRAGPVLPLGDPERPLDNLPRISDLPPWNRDHGGPGAV
ncbi:hypothetical protein RB595_000394 [Gaeumannomyces hyphopodioides]